jgi:glycosyltransferase involved in cell wall biosynthesis
MDDSEAGAFAKRILMTADAVGGVWDYALELAAGLGEAGAQVTLAVMGPPPDEGQEEAARAIPGLELCARPFKLEWMEEPWQDVAAAGDWLVELAARRDVDLVHLNGYVHARLPFDRPRLVMGHSCVLSWWRAVKGKEAPPAWDRYRREVGAGLAAADRVAAPTRAMLEALETHYGPLPPAEVIPNGRSEAAYGPGRKLPFVLSAGRLWDEAKNAGALCRVARRLPWPIKIAGAARPLAGAGVPPSCPVEALVNVECLGRLSPTALAVRYAAASIYALPARYEPFGLSVLEAALSGCALVLGDIPSLREVWGDAALFVHPDDEDALRAALTALIDRPDLRATLAARARRRAAQFSAAEMVRRTLEVYRSLLEPAGGGRGEADADEEAAPACVS